MSTHARRYVSADALRKAGGSFQLLPPDQHEATNWTDEQWIEAMRSTPPDPPREGAARCPRCGIVVPLAILDRHEVAVTTDGFDCAAYAPGSDMGRSTSRRCEAGQ